MLQNGAFINHLNQEGGGVFLVSSHEQNTAYSKTELKVF